MKILPIALQLYTIRDVFAGDVLGAVRAAAEMGYQGVEFAGFAGAAPAEIRAELDRLGLTAVCAHIGLDDLEHPETLDAVKALGMRWAAIPSLGEDVRPGGKDFPAAVERIRAVSRRLGAIGTRLLYHNHGFEFAVIDGKYGLDLLGEALSPEEMGYEIDTCWVRHSGVDPMAYLRQKTGRCPIVHLKDYTDDPKFAFRPVGEGVQDLPALLAAAGDTGAQWLVVEQDGWEPLTSLECARRSIVNIRRAQGA